MSDDGEEEVKVVEIPEPDGKRFFISHINSYGGQALLKTLYNADTVKEERAAHHFVGTLQSGSNSMYVELNPTKPEGCDKIVQMSRTRDFRDSILESDVIVYDLMTNEVEEVDYVIKTLKTSNLQKEKTLILLSSVMTWVNTPPKEKKEGEEGEGAEGEGEGEAEEEEEEEPEEGAEGGDDENKPAKKKYLFFKESDFHLRVPHERYFRHKNLETLALSAPKTQPLLKVHVLCCGLRYGNGENILFDHFRKAWLQKPPLMILDKGENLIPTIHVNDVARITKRLVDDNVKKEIIFAVDRTKKPTQKRIIQAISTGIGNGKVKNVNPDDVSDSILWKDFLMINLKMKTSDVFKDGEPPEDAEDPEAEAAKLKFPWHCETGIIENARKLNDEFNAVRNLNPVKIMVSGPPASGKTFYSQMVSEYYNIPRVHVKELTDKAFAMAKLEDEEGLAADIKAKLEELRDAAAAKIEEENAEKDWGDGEPPEIDKDSLPIRVPDDIIYQLLKIRLNENDCRNRGYVLEGFPRSYENC